MRWCSFTTTTPEGPGHLGAVSRHDDGELAGRVLDVGVWARSRGGETPADLVDLIEASPATQERVADLVRSAPEDGPGWVRPDEVHYRAPLRAPNSLRGFLAYRDHVERSAVRGGVAVPEAWDRVPVFFHGNRRSVVAPGQVVAWPAYTAALDYECAVAVVVGSPGRNLDAGQAAGLAFGYLILNDWTARDVQREELACGLGPAKSKDVGTTLGPWVVTPDEWDPDADHPVTAYVDGEPWSTGSTAGRRWSFGEMLSWASQDADLWRTDVLGSGTFAGGCGADLDRQVARGSVVTVRVQGLGEVANPVGERRS